MNSALAEEGRRLSFSTHDSWFPMPDRRVVLVALAAAGLLPGCGRPAAGGPDPRRVAGGRACPARGDARSLLGPGAAHGRRGPGEPRRSPLPGGWHGADGPAGE